MIKTGIFIRNDNSLVESVQYLFENTKLLYVIFKDDNFSDSILEFCNNNKIECISHNQFLSQLDENKIKELDIIFSYYYQKKLEKKILDFPKFGGINFHPAPLPKYRGVGNYSKCILDGLDFWGVSAHVMDEDFDNGALIKVIKFDINSKHETYIGLEKKTQKYMFELFCQMVKDASENNIKTYNDDENGDFQYLSREMIGTMKLISEDDSTEIIDRKIRAFWCPPFNGASIMIEGKQYTLVDEDILKEIAKLYNK